MGLSVLKGVYSSRADFLAQAQTFLSTKGLSVVVTDDLSGEFVLKSDASGQDTTENIEPGLEALYWAFTTFAADGANRVKLQAATFIDNFGTTPASPADLIGLFAGASTSPVDLGKCFDDAGSGDFIIHTDGAPGKGATWVGVWTSGLGGLYAFQGVPARFNQFRRIRPVSTVVGNIITLSTTPPKHWNPANFGGVAKMLEISQQGGTGPGTVERIEVISLTGNVLTLASAPAFTFNSNAIVGDWIHPRYLLDTTNADGGNGEYKTLGDFNGVDTLQSSVIAINGSNPIEGAPNTSQNSYEIAAVGVWDSSIATRGQLFQLHPAAILLVPKGTLIAGTDSLEVPDQDGLTFMKYDIRASAGSTNFFWAVRVA